MERGEVLGRSEVEPLQRIARSSPGLAEASILAAATARGLSDRPLALGVLREAEARHRDDPRLVTERFLLELDTGKIADAEAALDELERLEPGGFRVWRARARLFGRQGRVREAAQARQEMVRARPSWMTLWYVADAEIALGDAPGARRHLEQLLELSPGNPRGLAKMAELEWLLGDPRRAARIYEGLLQQKVTWENLSNHGWSLLLAGEYSAAAASLRRSLDVHPDDVPTRFNLATAHEGVGDAVGARPIYRDVLDRIARRERAGPLTVWDRLIKAQALARLGEPVTAVDLTLQALSEGDRDAQVLFQAALIYALCGDKNNAIVWGRAARQRLSPRWFTLPGFESLRGAPAYQELVAPRA
jgi:tetratricopeptide (TPR) repeat protein